MATKTKQTVISLDNTASSQNWRQTMKDTVRMTHSPIPTGEQKTVIKDDGKKGTQAVTIDRPSLGFQTELGVGKSPTWIPVDELDDAIETLQFFVENPPDVDMATSMEYRPVADVIRETISRIPRKNAAGEDMDGVYDYAFRVRQNKGHKMVRIPEDDFPEFVAVLKAYNEKLKPLVPQLVEAYAKEQEKKGEKS